MRSQKVGGQRVVDVSDGSFGAIVSAIPLAVKIERQRRIIWKLDKFNEFKMFDALRSIGASDCDL